MSAFPYRGLLFVLVTGGLTVAGACAANAAETDGSASIGGGNQVLPSISVPVEIDGNAVALLGNATTSGSGSTGSAPAPGSSDVLVTDGAGSVVGGNQVAPDVTAPVTADGNALAVLGDATAGGSAPNGSAPSAGGGDVLTTDGTHSIAGGNQVAPDVTAPVTVAGNAVSLLGDAAAAAETGTGTPRPAVSSADWTTDGAHSILGGNQIAPAITAPLSVSGNSVSVLGDGVHPRALHRLLRGLGHLPELSALGHSHRLPLLGTVEVVLATGTPSSPRAGEPTASPDTSATSPGTPAVSRGTAAAPAGKAVASPIVRVIGGYASRAGAWTGGAAPCDEPSLLVHGAVDGSVVSGPVGKGAAAGRADCAARLDLASTVRAVSDPSAGVLAALGGAGLLLAGTALVLRKRMS